MPRPKNERADSRMMIEPMSRLASTMIGPMMLGRTCRMMMRLVRHPDGAGGLDVFTLAQTERVSPSNAGVGRPDRRPDDEDDGEEAAADERRERDQQGDRRESHQRIDDA